MLSYLKMRFVQYWDTHWKFTTDVSRKGLHLRGIRDHVSDSIPVYIFKNRRREAVIHRLRVGHVGVKQYLYKIRAVDTPLCDCNSGREESIYHYIFECSLYRLQRREMLRELGKHGVNRTTLRVILGGENEYRKKITVILRSLMKYIVATDRLEKL